VQRRLRLAEAALESPQVVDERAEGDLGSRRVDPKPHVTTLPRLLPGVGQPPVIEGLECLGTQRHELEVRLPQLLAEAAVRFELVIRGLSITAGAMQKPQVTSRRELRAASSRLDREAERRLGAGDSLVDLPSPGLSSSSCSANEVTPPESRAALFAWRSSLRPCSWR
jgi:hypothetical protein